MKQRKRARHLVATGAGVLGGLAVIGACGPDDLDSDPSGAYEEIVIAIPDWAGGEANAAVAGHVLETEFEVTVRRKPLDQSRAWDALNDGAVHAILEDWGGEPQKETLYVEDKKSVVRAGELGAVGHIGWFVPKHFADAHPEVLYWENLNDFADDFRTEESGAKGQLLNGGPSYTTNDDAIIERLELDYTTVELGSETALLDAIRQADRQSTPLLVQFWQPHWLNTEVEMVEVELPPYHEGCQDDPERVACGYPKTPLPKYLNAEFAENGGAAAEFLKDFTWTTEEQNEVARLIEGGGMSPEAAATAWVANNPDAVARWLPVPED